MPPPGQLEEAYRMFAKEEELTCCEHQKVLEYDLFVVPPTNW